MGDGERVDREAVLEELAEALGLTRVRMVDDQRDRWWPPGVDELGGASG